MGNLSQTYAWEPAYLSAILETDTHKMLDHVREVERAIEKRLGQNPPPDATEEEAITKVRAALAVLSGERMETL